MNGMLMRNWLVVWLIAIVMVAVGCASTSNIANKATFGLVGGEKDSAEAEQKAQEREAKKAAKEQEKAEKRAKKAEQGDRGLLNRATFGLASGGADEDKEQKAAAKEAEREAEAAREAERQTAKQERERLNREAKAARENEKQAKKTEKSERSLLSRATFGAVGTDSEEERQQKEAEAAAKREEEEQRKAEKQAEKEAAREAKSERSLLNKATFGLAGTETEEERLEREAKEEAERVEREAEQERVRAENAERSRLNRLTLGLAGTETEEERQQKEAEEAAQREEKRQAELAKQEENANKTWLNRTTYGVLGEDYNDDALVAMAESDPDSLTPAQLAKAEERKQAIADHQARQKVESFSDPEARKLAGYPFHTEVVSRVTPKGNAIATATTETYSREEFGIADVGDVRIAVRGQTFKGDPRRSRLVVASNDRGPAQGSFGVGNQQLAYLYERGTTTVTFGSIEFTVADSMLSVGGVTVPVGQGRKLVVLDGGGSAQTYDID